MNDEVDLCPNCYTMKHLTSSGVCGRCEVDELDEILLAFAKRVENIPRGKTYRWTDEKQAILDWHNKQVFEIIGEDESDDDVVTNDLFFATRNGLRQQQRQLTKGEQ